MKTRAMTLGALLLLSACGGDGPTVPTKPSPPPPPSPPNVAGTYVGYPLWTTYFNRTHDGYSGSFRCEGSMTIVQEPGSSQITGFAVVVEASAGFTGADRCPEISFDLTGTVAAGGVISIVSRGPRPPAGPCPTPGETTFSGLIERRGTAGSSARTTISARGTVTVDCPGTGEGEYRFDQIISGWKD